MTVDAGSLLVYKNRSTPSFRALAPYVLWAEGFRKSFAVITAFLPRDDTREAKHDAGSVRRRIMQPLVLFLLV